MMHDDDSNDVPSTPEEDTTLETGPLSDLGDEGDSAIRDRIEDVLTSSDHKAKRHVHPRLMKMFEVAGMTASFVRAEGQYLWDDEGNRFLDFLGGGGVYLMGRNHPQIHRALGDVLTMNLPNLTVVNASVLSGLVAERLLEIGGPQFSKVVFANSGTECTEVALRFARNVTGRRRFLYLEGAFHGRTYAAMSCCGFDQLRAGIDPALPTCTPVQPGNIAQLRRELRMGDVAAFIFEPVQGMTGQRVDPGYLREAETLCKEHGTILVADEVQTGLGRTGAWFATREMGVRPDMLTTSKALSGGAVPVGAVLVDETIYDKVFSGFSTGLNHFSTFAENNLAMTAALTTLEVLEELDAPAQAKEKGDYLLEGLLDLADKYDCIDHVAGRGLMLTVYFKESASPTLMAQQKLLSAADSGAFAAAVHVDLYKKQRILAQIPGPGLNAIKILPPVVASQEDLDYFLGSLEDTLAGFYGRQGPIASLGRGVVETAAKAVGGVVPQAMPPLQRALGISGGEKKTVKPGN
ncbi:MAG: aspartate aminotransferase family protein [Myxococcales bacterium]|nr:aspartate aminotransferase family protein [Myxococcales bacterium]